MAGKVKFDGEAGSVELNRITAKKNYASSMQSHKMGATYAFDLILHKLAEEKYPDLANEVNGAVAVKQLPALTFQEALVEGTTDTYARDFSGNFTVGADKGDNGYFGFENEGVKDVGIRLEGTDHLKGVGFNYPWEVGGVKNIRYNADKKALCIVTGNDPSKWTTILEQSFVGNKKTEGDIEAFIEQEFRPAFECAYRANPLLVGTTLTLEAMNANIDSFGNQRRADGRLYSYCEVWRDGEYNLYYLNQERGQYEPNGVNLYDELSDEDRARVDSAATLDEKNEIFIANRIARFAEEAPSYFCIDDAIYQYTFLYMLVASDNFEKNMYPYKMKLLQDGSRWRFFQDDLDAIGPTDNQAQDTKSYSAEVEDFTDESQSAYVFKGEDSALWQAVSMAFPDRIRRMGRDILQAMYDLSPTGTQTLEKLMGFFDEYFFSRAQGYFPPSAYNNDAEIAYEEAWNNKDYVASVDIHPLAQSLGDHNLAERQFWEKRMLYLMSKFGFGGYGSYEDKELGVISFRTQTAQSFTLTPAIDSYPTILGGASQISSASQRVKAGTPVTLPAVGGNNTNTYIAGADWLICIGDLKDLKVDPSMVLALNVGSKRLQRLKVGDEDASAVTSTLEALAVQSCPSLTQVDARNLKSLTGSVNLSRCPRLREAMFGGTNVTTVTIAAGSKIEHLQLPDSVTVLDLRNTKFLSNFELGDYTHIGFLRLENNKYIDGFSALKNAYADGGGSLQNVRIVGFNYAGDSTDVDFIASLADVVNGIDSEGNPTIGKPIIEGTLNVEGSIYEDSAEVIRANYPNLVLNVQGGLYIRFEDQAVADIVIAKWGDGVGLTKEQAAEAKTDVFGYLFRNNTSVTKFNEARYFKQPISLYVFADGATNFSEITFADGVSITSGYYAFRNTALTKLVANNIVASGSWEGFCTNSALEELDMSSWDISAITTLLNMCSDAQLKRIMLPDGATLNVPSNMFKNCPIESISGSKLKLVGNCAGMFYGAGNGGVLDLSSWDVSEAGDMRGWNNGIFMSSNFDEINISGWSFYNNQISTTNSNGGSAFNSCKAKRIIMTGVTAALEGLGSLFSGCTDLEEVVGFSDIDFSTVIAIPNLISSTNIKHWDFSRNNFVGLTSMERALSSTSNVESYNFGDYGFGRNATSWYVWLHYGSNYQLRKCYGHLDASGATASFPAFNNATLIRRIELRGLGTHADWTGFNVGECQYWGAPEDDGTDPDGNLQSMIDTLLTYSFDRAAAGYSACTIVLHANTLARLVAAIGDSGMLQIINKGYTIINYTPAG